ncbi:O-methyltransferase [Pseudochelatococcus lubricantis]|uniref:O-methyltransferase n=1 Tax=Pseudochelatococcus lubricantis TaxID=1538102 RepID=UPI0035E82151
MTDLWTEVDDYLIDRLVPTDPVLDEVLRANAAAGLPAIDVAPNQGRLLHIFALMVGARRILEIGTLGAYSTIWLARALGEGGRLVTLEADAAHAAVARENIGRAALQDVVDLRVGPALETLPQLAGEAPFDLVFVDADKENNPAYLEWALRLSRPGTVIICDNVVRDGAIADPDSPDPRVQGTRRFFDMVAAEPRLVASAIQTVGGKGWDGFAIAVVR